MEGEIIPQRITGKVIVLLLVELLLVTSFCSLLTTQGIEKRESLAFTEHISFIPEKKLNERGFINWSFSGHHPSVGIKVWILDKANYDEFITGNWSIVGYQVSDGTLTEDSGVWIPTYKEEWHIVFFHDDDDIYLNSTVTANVTFNYGGLAIWALSLAIALPAAAVIAGTTVLTIFLIIRKKKQTNVED